MIEPRKTPMLTRREREMVDYAQTHLSAKEIAGRLGITERTVKFYLSSLYQKFDVHSRQELNCLLCARETGE